MIATPAVRALMALARAQVSKSAGHRAILAALTAWFASKEAIAAVRLPERLITMLTGVGIDAAMAREIGELLLAKPLTGRSRHGAPAPYAGMPAARRVASEEPEMRARYLLAAARRLTEALSEGTYAQGLSNERRFLAMHVAAGRNRRQAARRVDAIGGDGRLLVWRTAGDNRVEAACRALEGRLFTAGNPPGGALPGAVHSRCRCRADTWGPPGVNHLADLLGG